MGTSLTATPHKTGGHTPISKQRRNSSKSEPIRAKCWAGGGGSEMAVWPPTPHPFRGHESVWVESSLRRLHRLAATGEDLTAGPWG